MVFVTKRLADNLRLAFFWGGGILDKRRLNFDLNGLCGLYLFLFFSYLLFEVVIITDFLNFSFSLSLSFSFFHTHTRTHTRTHYNFLYFSHSMSFLSFSISLSSLLSVHFLPIFPLFSGYSSVFKGFRSTYVPAFSTCRHDYHYLEPTVE